MLRAGKVLAEGHTIAADHVHFGDAAGKRQRGFQRICQTAPDALAHGKAVHYDFHRMLDVLFQLDLFVKIIQVAVDLHTSIATAAGSIQLFLLGAFALALTGGIAEVDVIGGECMTFSQNFACPEHGISISDLSPRLFSFNNPLGACEKCTGLGTFMRVDEERILPNRNLSIREGAIKASGWYYAEGSVSEMYYLGLGKKYGFTLDTPIKEMSTEAVNALLYGSNGEKIEMHRTNEFGSGVYYNTFEGIVENLERRFRETNSEWMKEEIGSFMSGVECPDCHGKRLKPVVLAVTIGDKNISDFCEMSIRDELKFIAENEPNLTEKQKQIGGQIMKEIRNRLQFLQSVGLDYLTLARAAGTLSGGESQRIRLTTQIGSALSGVLYVLDEPSIGLHQRDNDKLIATLKNLRDLGNTVIVVEHDEDTMRSADYIVDVGPGAGVHGGEIVAAGSVKYICTAMRSITGDSLSGR